MTVRTPRLRPRPAASESTDRSRPSRRNRKPRSRRRYLTHPRHQRTNASTTRPRPRTHRTATTPRPHPSLAVLNSTHKILQSSCATLRDPVQVRPSHVRVLQHPLQQLPTQHPLQSHQLRRPVLQLPPRAGQLGGGHLRSGHRVNSIFIDAISGDVRIGRGYPTPRRDAHPQCLHGLPELVALVLLRTELSPRRLERRAKRLHLVRSNVSVSVPSSAPSFFAPRS